MGFSCIDVRKKSWLSGEDGFGSLLAKRKCNNTNGCKQKSVENMKHLLFNAVNPSCFAVDPSIFVSVTLLKTDNDTGICTLNTFILYFCK